MHPAQQPRNCITVTCSSSVRQSSHGHGPSRHFGDSASQKLASAICWRMFLVYCGQNIRRFCNQCKCLLFAARLEVTMQTCSLQAANQPAHANHISKEDVVVPGIEQMQLFWTQLHASCCRYLFFSPFLENCFLGSWQNRREYRIP